MNAPTIAPAVRPGEEPEVSKTQKIELPEDQETEQKQIQVVHDTGIPEMDPEAVEDPSPFEGANLVACHWNIKRREDDTLYCVNNVTTAVFSGTGKLFNKKLRG